MKKLGKKREMEMRTIEAYVTCYPSTKCDSDFLCACNCRHGQSSATMAPPQTTNCKSENARYWSNNLTRRGKSPYNSACAK